MSALATTCPCRTLDFSYFFFMAVCVTSFNANICQQELPCLFLVAGRRTFSHLWFAAAVGREGAGLGGLSLPRSGTMHCLVCFCLERSTSTQPGSDIERRGCVVGAVSVVSNVFSFILFLAVLIKPREPE